MPTLRPHQSKRFSILSLLGLARSPTAAIASAKSSSSSCGEYQDQDLMPLLSSPSPSPSSRRNPKEAVKRTDAVSGKRFETASLCTLGEMPAKGWASLSPTSTSPAPSIQTVINPNSSTTVGFRTPKTSTTKPPTSSTPPIPIPVPTSLHPSPSSPEITPSPSPPTRPDPLYTGIIGFIAGFIGIVVT